MDKTEDVDILNFYRPPFEQIISALDNSAGSDIFTVALDRRNETQ